MTADANADPSAALQTAMYAALTASSAVTAAFAALSAPVQVFDHVPRGSDGAPTKPYPFVAFGTSQSIGGEPTADCDDETEVFFDIEVWDDATARGQMGAKALASAVKKALGKVLTVTGFSVSVGHARDVRHLPEQHGVARSIVTLRYLMDPA